MPTPTNERLALQPSFPEWRGAITVREDIRAREVQEA
jgi:hypothetical protein